MFHVWITPPDENTPTLHKFSLLEKNFNQFMLGHHLVSLIQSNGCCIFDFEQIEAGEVYQCTKSTDRFEKRFATEDQLHEMECGHALATLAKPEFLDSEVVHNVLVLDKAKIHAQFDAVVFGRTEKETIAIVMEAKFKVHENDFEVAKSAAKKFDDLSRVTDRGSCPLERRELNEGSSWYISGFGYTSVAFMEASNSCLVFWR